jgi:hypothetical protein
MLCGSVFENVGDTRVSDALIITTKSSHGEPCTTVTAAPFHFVFAPIPSVDKKPLSVNNVGQKDFNTAGIYNQNFRKHHVEYRTQGHGNVTSWLNLSVKVLDCLLEVTQCISHTEGLTSLTNV